MFKRINQWIESLHPMWIGIAVLVMAVNLAIPFATTMQKDGRVQIESFGELISDIPDTVIAQDGKLVAKEGSFINGDYGVYISKSEIEPKTTFAIIFNETQLTIKKDRQIQHIPYKGELSKESLLSELGNWLAGLTGISVMSSILFSFLMAIIIVMITLIIAYFSFRKSVKYREMIRAVVAYLTIGSFVGSGIVGYIFSIPPAIAMAISIILGTVLFFFSIKNVYERTLARDYL
ncbi:DUF1189 family protein [Bacillus sp. JJ722]|uniref:DUF1189 family protein n=1 Tax=Bacillus sp. JJ722 TaxID=3122973 RepID=UPI002FFFB811